MDEYHFKINTFHGGKDPKKPTMTQLYGNGANKNEYRWESQKQSKRNIQITKLSQYRY